MKLYCSKILLFFLTLNILVTSYQVYNKNKPYIAPRHIPIYTSRVLSEKDIPSSIYDKDADIKSVKEKFDRQTSQRFEEYKERLKGKRQKRKEERDKNIQTIIEKDKREKSLAEKIEKGCLRCGCALGGVAASVGVFGGLGVYGSKSAAWAAITAAAKDAGIKKGLQVGLDNVMKIVTDALAHHQGPTIPPIDLLRKMTEGFSGDNVTLHGIFKCVSSNIEGLGEAQKYQLFFSTVKTRAAQATITFNSVNPTEVTAVTDAVTKGEEVALATAYAEYGHLYSAIGYSVLAIIIIILIMIYNT
nr:rifin PIR protein,putative [Plasmodium sp. DRC-Itaito]